MGEPMRLVLPRLAVLLAIAGMCRPAVTGGAPAQPEAGAAALADALARLRAVGFAGAADAVARRTAQRRPKMRLGLEEGVAAARALLGIAQIDAVRGLQALMPRSTVELARAVDERHLPIGEATAIAGYLGRVVAALEFEGLDRFDESHSHVIGRHWHEIDYRGEGMTWRRQRAHWAPRGVADFRSVPSIHAYFVGAEPLRHWQRVYRPRRRFADVGQISR
jgi:hypothetical protein